MKLLNLINQSSVYRFTLSDGSCLIGQVTREGDRFLQIGVEKADQMHYYWLNIDHIFHLEYIADTFREAFELLKQSKKPITTKVTMQSN